MNYQGRAVFLDSDMLLLTDINELFDLPNQEAVSVVSFKGQLIFERPSVMLFNCEKCTDLTLDYINDESTAPQSLEWAPDIGTLPDEWNYLVGYSQGGGAKLVHYTQGVPGYKECRDTEYADEWFTEKAYVDHHVSWLEIMGNSVHAPHVLKRLQAQM